MAERSTGSYAKDPRIDRAITWSLTTTAGLLFALCAYFFNGVTDTMKALNKSVTGLATEVAVLKTERNATMTAVTASIDELKTEQRELRTRIRDLEQR